jgi:hypothetical protein
MTVTRGRPLAAHTVAIREAVLRLADERDRMTVRGIFYALTVTGVVEKTDGGYRQVQRQVLNLRTEGALRWTFVADSTRWIRQVDTFDSAGDALSDVARLYRGNLWSAQRRRVEVWLEKDALADVVWPTIDRWAVPLMVSRGVPSATFVHSAAMAAQQVYLANGVETFVFCLYDYDGGGERAFRTVVKGMAEYAPQTPITVQRLALTERQVAESNLPTRPAKKKDPQAKAWGDKPCVELDAIDPDELCGLIDNAIESLVDVDQWQVAQVYEQQEKLLLNNLMEGLG